MDKSKMPHFFMAHCIVVILILALLYFAGLLVSHSMLCRVPDQSFRWFQSTFVFRSNIVLVVLSHCQISVIFLIIFTSFVAIPCLYSFSSTQLLHQCSVVLDLQLLFVLCVTCTYHNQVLPAKTRFCHSRGLNN